MLECIRAPPRISLHWEEDKVAKRGLNEEQAGPQVENRKRVLELNTSALLRLYDVRRRLYQPSQPLSSDPCWTAAGPATHRRKGIEG